MATTHGNDGKVAIGANVVGEITAFSYTEGFAVADDSALGDTSETHLLGGMANWNGTFTAWWDRLNAAQLAALIGSQAVVHFHPEGDATGDEDVNGTGTITGVVTNNTRADTVSATFTVQGTGALTHGAA